VLLHDARPDESEVGAVMASWWWPTRYTLVVHADLVLAAAPSVDTGLTHDGRMG
jgi:hypothetical protein